MLVGIFIGLVSALGAVWLDNYFKNNADKKNKKDKQISFLNSIKSELSTIWEHYYTTSGMGERIEMLNDNTGIDAYYYLFDNYFIIYDNNSNYLGEFDSNLSEKIVTTYTLAKSLKDSFMFNNQLLDKIRYYNDMYELSSQQDSPIQQHLRVQRDNTVKMWQTYGIGIKKIHLSMRENKELLINAIDKHIQLLLR